MHAVKRVRGTAEQEDARKKKEAGEIEVYRKLEAYVQSMRARKNHSGSALEHNTTLLRLNPEYYTMWNYRREILSAFSPEDLKKALVKELLFGVELFKRYPKVYWIWNHRRWVLNNLNRYEVWEKELDLVQALLERDVRNFHGWHYRRTVIKQLETMSGEPRVNSELEYTKKKIDQNFSNYSAFHNRSLLLSKTKPMASDFLSELNYAKTAVYMDPGDQSAWYFYHWVLFSDHWKSVRPQSVHKNELKEMEELAQEESDCVQCFYTIFVLSKLLGAPRTELKETLSKLDPLRSNRYLAL